MSNIRICDLDRVPEELLREITEYLRIYNPNPRAKYHSNAHMLGVWDVAKHIWEEESAKLLIPYNHIDKIILMVAATFHDFNHSGGRLPDNINVTVAAANAEAFVVFESKVLARNFPSSTLAFIAQQAQRLIGYTEFPCVNVPDTLLGKVLCDADMLWATLSKDAKIILEDLRVEMEWSGKPKKTYHEIVEQQRTFHENMVMYTETGQELLTKHGPTYLSILEQYAKKQSVT